MQTRLIALAFALSQSAAAQNAPATLREVMRINGATEDITGSETTTQILRDNRVAFFDHGRGEFIIFDSAGKRIGKFGRPGEGPGEFGAPIGRTYSLQVGLIGDSMFVGNRNMRRTAIFGPDMKFVRQFPHPPRITPVTTYNARASLDGDRILVRADLGEQIPAKRPDGTDFMSWTTTDSAIVILAKDGSIERRLASVPPSNSSAMIPRPDRPIGRPAAVPFGGSPLNAESPDADRIAIVAVNATVGRGTFTVTVTRTATGQQIYSKSFPFTPEPVTARMRDSALARADSSINRGSDPAENTQLRALVRERMPTTVTPFRQLTVGADGTAWLRKTGPNEGPDQYVVIDASGNLLPEVIMPRKNMRLLTGTRTSIWALERDDDGFVSVVRMMIGGR